MSTRVTKRRKATRPLSSHFTNSDDGIVLVGPLLDYDGTDAFVVCLCSGNEAAHDMVEITGGHPDDCRRVVVNTLRKDGLTVHDLGDDENDIRLAQWAAVQWPSEKTKRLVARVLEDHHDAFWRVCENSIYVGPGRTEGLLFISRKDGETYEGAGPPPLKMGAVNLLSMPE